MVNTLIRNSTRLHPQFSSLPSPMNSVSTPPNQEYELEEYGEENEMVDLEDKICHFAWDEIQAQLQQMYTTNCTRTGNLSTSIVRMVVKACPRTDNAMSARRRRQLIKVLLDNMHDIILDDFLTEAIFQDHFLLVRELVNNTIDCQDRYRITTQHRRSAWYYARKCGREKIQEYLSVWL